MNDPIYTTRMLITLLKSTAKLSQCLHSDSNPQTPLFDLRSWRGIMNQASGHNSAGR